jgi:hypothetical protein
MRTLYDSDTFSLTHMLTNIQPDSDMPQISEQYPTGIPLMQRHGFEIIDKRTGKEVYLDGSWAELFQQHIVAWQTKAPTQEEVENTLEQYAGLAQNPVLVH